MAPQAHSILTVILLCLLNPILATSHRLLGCQLQKPKGVSPLLGCPKQTIFVSQDPTNRFAKFYKIQDAIESL